MGTQDYIAPDQRMLDAVDLDATRFPVLGDGHPEIIRNEVVLDEQVCVLEIVPPGDRGHPAVVNVVSPDDGLHHKRGANGTREKCHRANT